MELVYLWVEKYKNIGNQGFNFSPRFTCKYDEITKKLTIEEKKDYVSIFPENINVTAIVGENGSGKSNILEALLSNFMSSIVPINAPYNVLSIFYNQSDEKLYYKELGHCSIKIDKSYLNESIVALLKYKIHTIKNTNIFTFHYNYGLDWIYNQENNLKFDALYHKNDEYKTPILLQPNKAGNTIHISNIDYLATRDILNFTIHKNISFDFINKFFTPTKCKLKFNLLNISKRDDNFFYNKIFECHQDPAILYSNKLIYFSQVYILRKTFTKGNENGYTIVKDTTLKEKLTREKLDDSNIQEYIDYIKTKKFEELYDDTIHYKTDKIKQTFLFIEYLKTLQDFDFSLLQENILEIEKNKDLLQNLAPWIEIEFLNDQKVSFYSLSYGQKLLVKFIYSLLNQLNNLTSHNQYKNILILLDEVELGLHPNWQREYLSILIKVLSTKIDGFDFKYNIICSTHSPFILSDIPKENVIFLEKGKQVYPKIETFGANIHALLSHGFFMKDGLMGEFAKSKINEVIDYLNGKKSPIKDDDEAQRYIHIIGEPIVKRQLQRMLDSKRTEKMKEIDALKNQIESLKNRLDILVQND